MAWVLLVAAAVFEIAWAVGLKYTAGFTRLWPSLATVAAMAVSVALLSLAVRTIPVGTAYAVWTGLGAVGTAALGILLMGEPLSAARVFFLALIVSAIAGLKFTAA
ncbi:MAG: quaternary ammonium compound-resistance protein SugE [Planctomycetota bacterium]|nr:MAG: quaternary ammonium compound-resistance protein SugE [Planctomycetota bacterium]